MQKEAEIKKECVLNTIEDKYTQEETMIFRMMENRLFVF